MLFRCAAKRYTKACRKGRLMQHIYFAKPKQRLLWHALILGVLAVGLMALAACGGTTAPSAPSAPTTTGGGTTGGGTAASPGGTTGGGTAASPGGAAGGGGGTAASPGGGGGGGGGGMEATVNMTDGLLFEPADVSIAKGGTITWKNTGGTVHTATGDPSKASSPADVSLPAGAKAWDSGDVQPGGNFSHTFDTSGTYKYVCVPHESGGMVGTITVK
jgi:plastocyanin